MSRVLPDYRLLGDKLMPINQSEIPCSSQRNFLSRLWPAAAWIHGKPDPAQISLSGFIDEGINLYSINNSKE